MDRLKHDMRIALRGFRRTPSFTITAVLILAVGIGMAVAMFTVYDAVLVRNLPVRDQDRVVEMYTYRGDPKTDYWLLRADLRTIASASRTMQDVGGVVHWGAPGAPILDGDRALVINRTTVTGNFFDVLGARPFLGRFLRPNRRNARARRRCSSSATAPGARSSAATRTSSGGGSVSRTRISTTRSSASRRQGWSTRPVSDSGCPTGNRPTSCR